MIDPANVAAVGADELLARYVLQSSHIRSNQTVKQDAFIPPPNLRLSVTRHLMATDDEIWALGEAVATLRTKTLYGRADVTVAACASQNLTVNADALPGNPNHANISAWPNEKAAQKIIALEIAAAAAFVANPRLR
jgi:hypothetical protein